MRYQGLIDNKYGVRTNNTEVDPMTTVQRKCSMIGCSLPAFRSLAIAPGTVVELCSKHFEEEGGVVEAEDAVISTEHKR